MKKRKSKILSFSILALCLACLAFGVYALKNATLTVNGTVGFTAHDCMVNVKAYIEGDGLTEEGTTATDGHPSEERELKFSGIDSNEVTVGGETSADWDKAVALKDTIYFTDLTDDGSVAPITIKFKLTNLSVYDVYATIANMEDLTAKGVSVVVSDEVVMQEANESTTDEEVLTAVFTLDTTKVTDAGLMEGFELKLDFGKHVETENGEEEKEEINFGAIETESDLTESLTNNDFDVIGLPVNDGLSTLYVAPSINGNEKYVVILFNSAEIAEEYYHNAGQVLFEQTGLNMNDMTLENRAIYQKTEKLVINDSREKIVDGDFVFYKDQNNNYYLTQYLGNESEVTLPEYAPDGISDYSLTSPGDKNSIEILTPFTNWTQELELFMTYMPFYYDFNITTVNIPKNVTVIGENAFYFATNLINVNIPDDSKLKTIEIRAFVGCMSLEKIDIPASLNTIVQNAFGETGSNINAFNPEAEIVLDLRNVSEVGEIAFINANIDKIIVPFASEEERPEGWHSLWANSFKGEIVYTTE